MLSPNALKMSAEVIMAVLQTALLGFFRAFTTREITCSLFNDIYSRQIPVRLVHKPLEAAKWLIKITETYKMSSNTFLWYIENRRTLLRVSQSKTQSLDSNPDTSTWKRMRNAVSNDSSTL